MLEAVMGWVGTTTSMCPRSVIFGLGHPMRTIHSGSMSARSRSTRSFPESAPRCAGGTTVGDSWQHDVTVEAINEPASDIHYPICTDGAQACPPEDCGGVTGYDELRMVLADPDHLEYEHLSAWAPDGFDPEVFDQIAVNRRLPRVR